MHVRTEKFIILRAYIGWGGFSVYRKIPVFLKNRFCQTLNTEKPEKDEKSENRHKNVEPAHFCE